jgi:hypothetical protein
LIDSETGLTDDSSESASVQLGVVWNNNLRERFFAAKNQMASVLAPNKEARVSQSLDTFSS